MSESKPINRPEWKRLIGIMGGLGPHAHIELERLLLAETENLLGRAAQDQDYPAWMVSCVPSTPDRTLALLEGGPSPLPALVQSAERLSGPSGADFAVIPCNTAHAYLEELRSRVSIPLVDMVYGSQLSRVNGQMVRRALGAAHAVTVGSSYLRAFRNGLCPSCSAKRAAAFAALLKDELLEDVPHALWIHELMVAATAEQANCPNRCPFLYFLSLMRMFCFLYSLRPV